ncbi:MAG: hypothetical protein KGL53_05120, partial [Elusimicrobia bacterium]|nr:hypothetical protein [Elusimicrobiota bacterium]
QGAPAAAAALLSDPAARARVVADVASDMERGASTQAALGAGFEPRVAESLASQLRAHAFAAENARIADTQRSEAERRAALKQAEAGITRLERELTDGKLLFAGSADVELLTSLEEYRQGKKRLSSDFAADATADPDALRPRYLAMLQDVCRTHYRSMRYDPSLIVTLCGP